MHNDCSTELNLELNSRGEDHVHPWHYYVAIGDSFTEGVGDPVEGFAKFGAADRLAVALR